MNDSRFLEARVWFHWRLANLLLRLHWPEAAAHFYGRALRLHPDNPHIQLQHAHILLEVPHRRVEAITAFEKLNTSWPSSRGYYLVATGLKMESRHEEAVQAFEEAARLDPKAHQIADYSYNYAVSLTALGRFEEAAEAFQTATRVKPSDAEAWWFLGMMFAALGRWRDAVPCQERAMRLAPSVEHGLHLAETLQWLNRLKEAERVLRESLVIDSKSTDVKEALAQLLASEDRHDEALTLARELCAVKGRPLSSQVALAGVLCAAGRFEEALQEATGAAEASALDPNPHVGNAAQAVLGSIHVEMNNGAAALAAFDRCADYLAHNTERFTASFRVWCAAGRGNALSVLGRHVEAMSAFEDALRDDPEYFERSPEGRSHYDRSLRETQPGNQARPGL